ncbi:MAG: hypothetical protein H6720_22750 [Sandaracinus sp.]|nr:hypothetical protein [Sandaracinus sp.]
MHRSKNTLALAGVMASLCLGATSAQADAPLRVRWDCYLEGAAIGCNALANAYAESTPGVVLDSEEADLEVQVRSVDVTPRRRYLVDITRPGDAPSTLRIARDIANSRGSDQTLLDVLALLHRGTLPFLDVSAPGRVEGGVLTLRAGASSDEGPVAEPSPWFVRPTVSGQLVSAGVRIYGVGGGLEVNRSTPTLRLRLAGDVSYRYVDFALPGGDTLRGSLVRSSTGLTVARSLGRGTSVAVLASADRQPQNNLALRTTLGVGFEWLRSPFLATDGTNFGIRYRVRAMHDRYVVETSQGHEEHTYPRHVLGLVGLAHYDAIDLSLDVSVGAPLLDPSLWDVNGSASITFRVAGALEVGVGASFVLRGGAIHEPADADALDPVATLLAGSDFGRLTVEAELSLSYTFGNGALRTQDRRWR